MLLFQIDFASLSFGSLVHVEELMELSSYNTSRCGTECDTAAFTKDGRLLIGDFWKSLCRIAGSVIENNIISSVSFDEILTIFYRASDLIDVGYVREVVISHKV